MKFDYMAYLAGILHIDPKRLRPRYGPVQPIWPIESDSHPLDGGW